MRVTRFAPFAAALFALATGASDGPPRVVLFSPEGSAPGAEQVRLRFSSAMVELGDPRAPAPASGVCGAGQGRWVDTREWAFDFASPLPGGVRCRFALKSGLKALSGESVSGPQAFDFDTGGPSIVEVIPEGDGQRAEEDQVFALALNAPATPQSVAVGARCVIEGLGEAVPFDPIPQAEAMRLRAGAGNSYPLRGLLEKAGIKKPRYAGDEQPGRKLTLFLGRCRRALPPGGRVSLIWGANIRSPSGLLASVEKRIEIKVRPAFTARFSCSRVNAASGCSPVEGFTLNFTGQLAADQASRIRLVAPDGKSFAPKPFEKKPRFVDGIEFAPPLRERTAYRIALPAALTDDAGRPLANAARFPLAVRTDEAPPLVKFAGTFGILELLEGAVLPVTMRNVEPSVGGRIAAVAGRALRVDGADGQVAGWLRRLDKAEERTFIHEPIAGSAAEEDDDDTAVVNGRRVKTRAIETTRQAPLIAPGAPASGLSVPKPGGARTFEVVGIPLRRPGFYVVELASPRLGSALLGRGRTRYVATGALVTDLSVHFAWGKGRSIAWVTRLHDAEPMVGARVTVTDSCDGSVLAQAVTDGQGRAMIGEGLPEPGGYQGCQNAETHPLMVSARLGEDYSFTLTSWNKGIATGDFHLPAGYGFDRAPGTAVFDRTLLRAGETVHLKAILRTTSDAGIGYPSAGIGQGTLTIRHTGSDAAYRQPITIGRDGIGLAQWTTPKEAALGEYQVSLAGPGIPEPKTLGAFQVEEYRLPTMRATVSGPKKPQVAPRSVPLDLSLTYYSGGAASGAAVTIRSRVKPRAIDLPDYPDFTWTADKIVQGIVPQNDGDEEDASDGEAASASRAGSAVRASVIPLGLDANGAARADAPVGTIDGPSELVAEMDYNDANGERRTASARVPVDPAAVRLGLRTDGWLMKKDDARLKIVVLDLQNRPVRGQPVHVQLYSRETLSYRKRLIGGFYAYDNSVDTRKLDAACDETTDDHGLAECRLEPGVSGEVIALAITKDSAGREARASTTLYVAGDDDWWFGGDNGDRMDLLPERPEYAIGETARFQVRMPFRSARALVTVMRDGVMDSFVTELSGRQPVIEVPMRRGYSPNVYVSVMAVRGRIAGWRLWLAELARKWDLPWLSREAAAPTALVDLAKPSYRLGIAHIRVGWDEHRLRVHVQPAAERYKVRQTADVGIVVTAPGGGAPRSAEVAVAAVDEALLDMKPNDSWDVLTTMMAERPVMVQWSTAQTQVVGKRHYGKKAVPAGGGGGALGAQPRADFKPLLLWRGRVPLDAVGRARVAVPLNDSLSSFRVVAVATAGPDLFGIGAARVVTTQDLILLPGLPPLVRTGDSYLAEVTARNTSDHAMRARVSGIAGGPLPALTVDLEPGQARRVVWRVRAPADEGAVRWRFEAAAAGASDAVEVTQTVAAAVPVQTLQATLVQVKGETTLPTAPPADALPGRGGIVVSLAPRLAGSMEGAKAYARDYPYDCFEQTVSRAVILGDRAMWDHAMAVLPRYLDENGLIRFFPADWIAGDDSLTAYVLTLSAEMVWAIPDAPRARIVGGLKALVGGGGRSHGNVLVAEKGVGIIGRANLAGDLGIRRVAAIAALARAGEASPDMLGTVAADLGAWPTSVVADWLDGATRLGARDESTRASAALRARLDSQGTAFAPTRADAMWWLLGSPDTTAARILMATATRSDWAQDVPRVARGLVARTRRGAWDTTVANALATIALGKFSARFEREPVSGQTMLALGPQTRVVDWSRAAPPATSPAPGIADGGLPEPMPDAMRAPNAPGAVALAWAGQVPLVLTQRGTGAPWATILARAAVLLRQPYTSGYTVRRTITPVSQAQAGEWHRGDVMRIRIDVAARADANWTVIDDPVPAGATILGGGLGGRSVLLDQASGKPLPGPAPAFVERKQEAARAWFDSAPRGPIAYEYTLRLGTPGTFALPPTRVEAMYVPGMIALLPNAPITVLP